MSPRNIANTSATIPGETTAPYRQIRALYDDETITVYQAYNAEIATQAVLNQKLNASPHFKAQRMTWIKPSWCWMMYRAGYSYKDSNQERILALKMKHEDFTRFLERAVLATENPVDPKSETAHEGRTGGANKTQAQDGDVKVQWDPERSVRLGRLDFRSIQIGVRGATRTQWIEDWIVSIEDVTEKAKALKAILDELPDISEQELLDRDVLPRETPFEVSEPLQQVLGMC